MSSTLKSKVVRGTFWVLCERLSTQAVTFGVGIILARLLSPNDYGTIALLGIFTAIAGMSIVVGGFDGMPFAVDGNVNAMAAFNGFAKK